MCMSFTQHMATSLLASYHFGPRGKEKMGEASGRPPLSWAIRCWVAVWCPAPFMFECVCLYIYVIFFPFSFELSSKFFYWHFSCRNFLRCLSLVVRVMNILHPCIAKAGLLIWWVTSKGRAQEDEG